MNFNENASLRQIVNFGNFFSILFCLRDIDVVNIGFKFEKDRIIDDRITSVNGVCMERALRKYVILDRNPLPPLAPCVYNDQLI